LPRHALRNSVPVLGTGSDLLSLRERAPTAGVDTSRTAIDSFNRGRADHKEIANHFCLSEQTVKNHLYRMQHKIGAEDRLGIVQVCQTQGS